MTRVAIVGAGGIGGVLAAAAQEAGIADLIVCVRHDPGRLVVQRDDGTSATVTAPRHTDPATVGPPADWVLLAVKGHQTAGAAPWLAALCDERTTVVALQNGVEQRESIAPFAPVSHVLPTAVWFPATAVAPGQIRQRAKARVQVPDDERGRAFAALLGEHGGVEVAPDWPTVAWRKLAQNALAPISALTLQPIAVLAREDVRELARAILLEVAAVARAEGARLTDEDALGLLGRLAAMPQDTEPSLLTDRRAGRPLEWDPLIGVVGRKGREHGVPTPACDTVAPLLAACA